MYCTVLMGTGLLPDLSADLIHTDQVYLLPFEELIQKYEAYMKNFAYRN